MPTREQVRQLLGQGLDYQAAGRRLGIPAGQAYLIATGVPADGSDTIPDREMADRDDLLPVSQRLANPPHHNPTGLASAADPKYTVVPQRQRRDQRAAGGPAHAASAASG